MSGAEAQSTDPGTAEQAAAPPRDLPPVAGPAGPEPAQTTVLPTGGVEALERPEAQVGMAFAGGLVAALILKRLVG